MSIVQRFDAGAIPREPFEEFDAVEKVNVSEAFWPGLLMKPSSSVRLPRLTEVMGAEELEKRRLI
jgi:hypothetical protein